MSIRRIAGIQAIAVLLTVGRAEAQRLTVQQPVVRQFFVDTTVSVPDRGGLFLGGVSRAASSHRSFGPFRSGTSTGLFREHTGVSVHVFIHDLDAMDRELLSQGCVHQRDRDGPPLNGMAEHAYRSLMSRHAGVSGSAVPPAPSTAPPQVAAAENRAERFYRLGLRAEERGAPGVARLHYRMAVRYGSQAANEKLAALER